MSSDDYGQLDVDFRRATPDDADFIVEMARHACVIEDWPLPDSNSEETRSLLPTDGEVAIVATDGTGARCGAAWTLHHDPPLTVDASPEIAIAVTPGKRGMGIGGAVHLYRRRDFREIGQGRGALGVAMRRDLR